MSADDRKLWQSVSELHEDKAVLKSKRDQEFVQRPKDVDVSKETADPSRRHFLKWMSGASALMATTGCKFSPVQRRKVEKLIPHVNKPDGLTYGVPTWYSSSSADGYGVLVKTREGRPIKLEGNPDHPVNQNGLDASTQASILDLYNPERIKGPLGSRNNSLTWDEADGFIKKELREARSGSVRVLTGPVYSLTLKSVLKKFLKQSNGKHHTFEATPSSSMTEAYKLTSGRELIPTHRFDKANVVVSVDADFLGSWLRPVENSKLFSKTRKVHDTGKMSRLFVFESRFSQTGVASDHRASIAPADQLSVLLGLANEVSKKMSVDAETRSVLSKYSLRKVADNTGVDYSLLKEAADELLANKGKSIVVAGESGPQALEAQLAAVLLNKILGNYGKTLDLGAYVVSGTSKTNSFDSLVNDALAGKVDFLLIQGANPVYSRPNSKFEEALGKIKTVVVIDSEMTETAKKANYVLGESHFLEAWGDSQIRRGVYGIQQPVVEPLHKTRSFGENLVAWMEGEAANYHETLRAFWKKEFYKGASSYEHWWHEQLRNGVLVKSKAALVSVSSAKAVSGLKKRKSISSPDMQLVLYKTGNLGDGRQANNAWLQEIPESISKVCWSNFVSIAPAYAKELGVKQNDLLSVSVGSNSFKLPAFIQPGLRKNVVAVALGYGRKSAGTIGTGVGQNAFELAVASNGNIQLRGQAVKGSKAGGKYELACTQGSFNLQGRDSDILHHLSLGEFSKNPKAAQTAHISTESIYGEKHWVYPEHKWGMAIDLSSCTGCNACVVGCYSENNVPVVGEEQVRKGRHMAWMRMDLYYNGSEDDPEANVQGMLCQQCDNAPCETVCPVLATTHSNDGLNEMTYNRCVGTRYCANNCPYKVRRFNYHAYSDALGGKMKLGSDPLPMMLNPDVSVRSRGVMEKCTFCVQRIRTTAGEYKRSGKKMPDGEVKTACQQSCPTDAIIFGDLNDPKSEVSKYAEKAQSFKVLEALNVRPNVSYLPRIRNKGTA
jgi:molybdopterin-containing oxidoreductase family iron-sulfur binding subunit